ncbi:hypothetical protein GCM10028778_08290 [Barrientosiimonas marina]|uniref:RimK family alpha-L-glutamate ligase n=1 Tax=Lentibacillus kimchii TaxID=1542911 RepID=A0ABW2UVP8_9BACI
MNLTGWIVYNGYLPGTKFRDFAEWIQRAAANQGIRTTIYKNNHLLSCLTSDSVGLVDTETRPDFVVFLDKDIYLARQLELMGIRVFNHAEAIAASDDKIASYQVLAAHNFPVPKTVIAPKAFYNTGADTIDDYQKAVQLLGFPLIVKEAFGSFGEQVHLIHNQQELTDTIQQLQGRSFMMQEFIASSYGQDKRLHIVGNKVVAAMRRHSASDFRSNITTGGTMEAYQPTQEEERLAIATAKVIGADFAGVDLLIGPDGTPIICEINSNAHIRNLFDCTGINAADAMMAYIQQEMRHNHGRLADLP